MNILVSGIASDIGFGVGKILKDWGIFDELHGIDVDENHIGNLLFDFCDEAPLANNVGYLDWVETYITLNNISLFIPTSEAEIGLISRANIKNIGQAKLLINSPNIILTALDKFETLRFLDSKLLAVPKHGLVGKTDPKSYPIIIKPRYGQGSKNVILISNKDEYPSSKEDFVWQSKLEPDDEEYTCTIYISSSGLSRNLIIKRKLVGGLTGKGEVIENPKIENYIISIANVLGLNGVINVQLRNTKIGPLLFEINPRLSSTLVFRDLMGFQDLRWWVSEVMGLKHLEYVKPPVQTKFFRGAKEYIVFPDEAKYNIE